MRVVAAPAVRSLLNGAESEFAIRGSRERHGHIQESIVQNVRATSATAMQNEPDLRANECRPTRKRQRTIRYGERFDERKAVVRW
jgi:hypothetical protein